MNYKSCPKCQTKNPIQRLKHFSCRACRYDDKDGYPSHGMVYQTSTPGGAAALAPPALFFADILDRRSRPLLFQRTPKANPEKLTWKGLKYAFEQSVAKAKALMPEPRYQGASHAEQIQDERRRVDQIERIRSVHLMR